MKINFDDGGYVEFRKSNDANKVIVIVSAKDHLNNLKKITNAAEVTLEEFKQLIKDIGI